MVRLSRITTRTGDDGTSALADTTRRPKTDLRFAVMGSVDEANCALGMARLHADGPVLARLTQLQNDLFDLGADISTPEGSVDWTPVRLTTAQVEALDEAIAGINAALSPLNSFILPGGSALSAHLHLARAITRRAERDLVALMAVETINPEALRYLNRLSDLLFVMARQANATTGDLLWQPGGTPAHGG